jgi:chromosome segregation ATPase
VGVHVERRLVAQESLLQRLEDLAGKVRSLEREKRQAAATIEALERGERQATAAIEAFERGERQAALTIQELEREKKQAALTIQELEREVGKLGALIALASEKVDEMLKEGTTDDMSQPQAVNVAAGSKGLEQPGESSADPEKKTKRLFPQVFIPD